MSGLPDGFDLVFVDELGFAIKFPDDFAVIQGVWVCGH